MSICALEILLLLLTSFIITVNCMPNLDPKFNCCHLDLTSTYKIFMIMLLATVVNNTNHVINFKIMIMATMLVVLLLELALLRGAVGDQLEMSLNGDSWSLSDTDGRVKAIKAQVPGSVHLDLM